MLRRCLTSAALSLLAVGSLTSAAHAQIWDAVPQPSDIRSLAIFPKHGDMTESIQLCVGCAHGRPGAFGQERVSLVANTTYTPNTASWGWEGWLSYNVGKKLWILPVVGVNDAGSWHHKIRITATDLKSWWQLNLTANNPLDGADKGNAQATAGVKLPHLVATAGALFWGKGNDGFDPVATLRLVFTSRIWLQTRYDFDNKNPTVLFFTQWDLSDMFGGK